MKTKRHKKPVSRAGDYFTSSGWNDKMKVPSVIEPEVDIHGPHHTHDEPTTRLGHDYNDEDLVTPYLDNRLDAIGRYVRSAESPRTIPPLEAAGAYHGLTENSHYSTENIIRFTDVTTAHSKEQAV